MMNCEKHLSKILTSISFSFWACLYYPDVLEETRNDDYLARVNNSYLTREELASLADTSKLNPEQKDQIIKNWVYYEMLFQKADKEGVTTREDYKRILKNF